MAILLLLATNGDLLQLVTLRFGPSPSQSSGPQDSATDFAATTNWQLIIASSRQGISLPWTTERHLPRRASSTRRDFGFSAEPLGRCLNLAAQPRLASGTPTRRTFRTRRNLELTSGRQLRNLSDGTYNGSRCRYLCSLNRRLPRTTFLRTRSFNVVFLIRD